MKTLIINGSPREDGDTIALLSKLKEELQGDKTEILAYKSRIKPCLDCRCCFMDGKCPIRDDMHTIYDGDYQNLVIASPIFMSGFPGPFVNILNRLQVYHAAEKIGMKIEVSPKKGAILLVGGGTGNPNYAIRMAKFMLTELGATFDEDSIVLSLHTDTLPASKDEGAVQRVKKIANAFNSLHR